MTFILVWKNTFRIRMMWPHLYWQSWYIMQTLWPWLHIGIPLTWKRSSTKVVHNAQILPPPTRCAKLIYMRTHTSIYRSEIWPCIWSWGICRKLTQVSAKSTGNRGKHLIFQATEQGKLSTKVWKLIISLKSLNVILQYYTTLTIVSEQQRTIYIHHV